ncbi:MAG: hypothetical protein VB009_02385 [Erysipelotrichaceae bacterium]|nr:hypothetical protein [Erysipelotrichaceae bacterium]
MTLTYININQISVLKQSTNANDLSEQLVHTMIKEDMVEQLHEYFFDNKAIKNYRFSDHKALIHCAAQYDAINCLRLIIEAGSDINLLSPRGIKPLEYAINHHADKAINLLKELGAKAFDQSLLTIIEQATDISSDDKMQLKMLVKMILELNDIIVTINDYIEQLCKMTLYKNHEMIIYQAMNMIMKVNQNKLSVIYTYYNTTSAESDLFLLNKYQLTQSTSKEYVAWYECLSNHETLELLINELKEVSFDTRISWQRLSMIHEKMKMFTRR